MDVSESVNYTKKASFCCVRLLLNQRKIPKEEIQLKLREKKASDPFRERH